jgi:CHAD domain-containing protein
MKDYATRQVSHYLDALVFDMHQARRLQDVESVHKLRVAIRRFRQALRVFETYFPAKRTRVVRKEMQRIRYLAGDVRERDIAIEIILKAGLSPDAMVAERNEAKKALMKALDEVCDTRLAGRWRSALGLHA